MRSISGVLWRAITAAVALLYGADGYTWKNDKYDLTKRADQSSCPAPKFSKEKVVGCLFAMNYCSQLDMHGNVPACHDEQFLPVTFYPKYVNKKQDKELTLASRDAFGERETYEPLCKTNGVFQRESAKYNYEHTCRNTFLQGNPRFGLQKMDKEFVFITGPDSPLGYHEGVQHRIFQIEIPPYVTFLTVWPYKNNLFKGAVTKVQFQGDVATSVTSTIQDWAENKSWFRLQIMRDFTCTDRSGTLRANVIQVAKGEHVSRNSSDRLHALVRETWWHTGIAYIPYDRFKGKPVMLVQALNLHKWWGYYLMVKMSDSGNSKAVTMHGYPDNRFVRGYVGAIALQLHRPDFSDLFGPYIQVVARRGVTGTNQDVPLPFKDLFPSTMAFVQPEETFKSSIIISSSTSGYKDFIASICKGYLKGPKHTDHLVFNFVNSYEKDAIAVKESLTSPAYGSRYVNLGCPYLSSQGTCAGLYKLSPQPQHGAEVWIAVGNANTYIRYAMGAMECVRNGQVVDSGKATCIFSDTYCRYLTIIKKAGPDRYAMYGDHVWGYGGGGQLPFSHKDSYGDIVLQNYSTMIDNSYVCENDILSKGPVYGLNSVNDDKVYVVGEKHMVEGLYYRVFQVDAPADGSPITVYPMGFDWGKQATATKLTVQNTSDSIVPRLVHSRQATFRMELWYPLCVDKTTKKGTIRINVLQVRTGRWADPYGKDEVAANTSDGTAANKSYKYAFWNSDKGSVEKFHFSGVPILFSQIYEFENKAHYYQSMAVSNVSATGFDARLQGYQKEVLPKQTSFHWIGIYSSTAAAQPGSTLFGAADYVYGTGEVGSSYRAAVDYSALDDAESAGPMVFIESTDPDVDTTRNAYVTKVGTGGMEAVTGMDTCKELKAPPRGFNWIAISKWITPKKMQFDHNLEDSKNPFTQSYCEKLVVLGNNPLDSGVYESIGDHKFGRTYAATQTKDVWANYSGTPDSTPNTVIELIYSKAYGLYGRDYIPMRHAVGEHPDAFLTSRQVQCIKGYDYGKLGRLRGTNGASYNVGSDINEGPYAVNRYAKTINRDTFVFFKYFQMELKKADATGDGLYTYVGGEDFGDFHIFGTPFAVGTISVTVAFERINGKAFYVKPMFRCGSGDAVKVNVLLLREGERTHEGISFYSRSTNVKHKPSPNAVYKSFETELHHNYENATIITALQKRVADGGYVSVSHAHVEKGTTRISAHAYGLSDEVNIMPVAALFVKVGGKLWKGMYTGNLAEKKIVGKHMGRIKNWTSSFEYHTGSAGYFIGNPFIVAASKYVEGADPGSVNLVEVSESVVRAGLVYPCAGDDWLEADLNFLAIGHFVPVP